MIVGSDAYTKLFVPKAGTAMAVLAVPLAPALLLITYSLGSRPSAFTRARFLLIFAGVEHFLAPPLINARRA